MEIVNFVEIRNREKHLYEMLRFLTDIVTINPRNKKGENFKFYGIKIRSVKIGFEMRKVSRSPRSSDLRRSQSGILPRTVFLTICDCRPIRCTSHGLVYGYPLPLQSDRRGPVALFISRLWQRERSYNESNRPRSPREQWSRSAVRS